METNKVKKFMGDINTVLEYVQASLRTEEIVNFKLADIGEIIRFTVLRGRYDNLIEEIEKLDENSLQMIYGAVAARYQSMMEIGATSFFKDGNVTWNLAPVIGEHTMIEFCSPQEKDQKWFYEELESGTKVKGHN